MKSFLNKDNFLFFILLFLIILDGTNCSRTLDKEKQFNSSYDLKINFLQLPISVSNIVNNGLKSDLETDVLVFLPFSLKVVNPILQTVIFIKFEDLIIFNNFNVEYDINVYMRNIFGMADTDKNMNVRIAIQDMQNKFNYKWNTCRIIFSTDTMKNKLMTPASNNAMSSKCASDSPSVSPSIMFMNIFCFESLSHTYIFESAFTKNYKNFLYSIPLITIRLYYYNFKPAVYKIIFFLNENNTSQLPYAFPNQNFLSHSIAMTNSYKYAFLAFSSDGVILSDSPYNQVTSVIYSFNFEDIRDCAIETVNKKLVFGEEQLAVKTNKCCIKFDIMRKDLSITSLILCSYTFEEYKCDLEINYIQNILYDKCPCKLIQSLTYAFDNGINLNEIKDFSFLSQGYIYTKIYEFFTNQLTYYKSFPSDKQTYVENKLIKMFQELGPSFRDFARSIQNGDVVTLLSRCEDEGDVVKEYRRALDTMPHHSVVGVNFGMSIKESHPNIFHQCETHPKMKDCICAAFPLSQICVEKYCYLHPNFYECSPDYCLQNPQDSDACKCKFNPFDIECKCKLNPLRKQCHCLKYPFSSYCLPGYCHNDNNEMEIYCLCQNNQNSPECKPEYCHENKFDSRCKCLLNPNDKECKCITYQNNPDCGLKSKNNISYNNPKSTGTYQNEENDKNLNDSASVNSKYDQSASRQATSSSTSANFNRNKYLSLRETSKNKAGLNNTQGPGTVKDTFSDKPQFSVANNENKRNNNLDIATKSKNQPVAKISQTSNSNGDRNYSNGENESNQISNKIAPNQSNGSSNTINVEQQRVITCSKEDTFCICREHPFYQKCVCLAHNMAEICDSSFCTDEKNKKSYECNPRDNCMYPSNSLNENCSCKQNFTKECKCKLDPLSQECFCLKFPNSYLCNIKNCADVSSSTYCKCANVSTDKECLPDYCAINANSAECTCLTNPSKDYCQCLNNPSECNGNIKNNLYYNLELEISSSVQLYTDSLTFRSKVSKFKSNERTNFELMDKNSKNSMNSEIFVGGNTNNQLNPVKNTGNSEPIDYSSKKSTKSGITNGKNQDGNSEPIDYSSKKSTKSSITNGLNQDGNSEQIDYSSKKSTKSNITNGLNQDGNSEPIDYSSKKSTKSSITLKQNKDDNSQTIDYSSKKSTKPGITNGQDNITQNNDYKSSHVQTKKIQIPSGTNNLNLNYSSSTVISSLTENNPETASGDSNIINSSLNNSKYNISRNFASNDIDQKVPNKINNTRKTVFDIKNNYSQNFNRNLYQNISPLNKSSNTPLRHMNYNPIAMNSAMSEEDKHILTIYKNQLKFNNDMSSKLQGLESSMKTS